MVQVSMIGVIAVALVGCAGQAVDEPVSAEARHDAGSAPDSASEPESICDGSQQIRFGYDSTNVDPAFVQEPFFNHYGPEFFYLRGDCRYVRGGQYDREFREGTLSSADAEQLARELDFATLGQRFVRAKDDPCWDQPTERVHGPSSTFSCRCCGAYHAVENLVDPIAHEGTPVHGEVTAAAVEVARPEANAARPSWPPIADIAELLIPGSHHEPRSEDGRRFDDPYDGLALRALRDLRRQNGWIPPSFEVQDDAKVYRVYVRDELPADMEAAVEELLAEREPSAG